ncbi:DUF3618 domain-containing protein [Dactylosporangium sp. NPDC000521]|uniref:DUF3618 domain-containing protein n=1 Tax=Dactylosporangium sp. NPDC000521 TaxID=3363975 RepID=UPI003687E3A8
MAIPRSGDEQQLLREQIARTRAELGNTVEALAAKADVKARAKDAAAQAAERAKGAAADAAGRAKGAAAGAARSLAGTVSDKTVVVRRRPLPLAAIGAALVAVLVVLAVRRRARSSPW